MGIVIWEVGKGEEMEVSNNGMQMFAVGSNDKGTKICSGIDDDERVNEVNCRGTFKDRDSVIIGWKHGMLD